MQEPNVKGTLPLTATTAFTKPAASGQLSVVVDGARLLPAAHCVGVDGVTSSPRPRAAVHSNGHSSGSVVVAQAIATQSPLPQQVLSPGGTVLMATSPLGGRSNLTVQPAQPVQPVLSAVHPHSKTAGGGKSKGKGKDSTGGTRSPSPSLLVTNDGSDPLRRHRHQRSHQQHYDYLATTSCSVQLV